MRAKKQFGQHFLVDDKTIAAIIAAANLAGGDEFVEIGPGRGALTTPLLASGASLTAVEIDSDCAALLRRKFGGRLTVVEDDVLRWDFVPGRRRWIGNLPYNISSPLLMKLCTRAADVIDGLFMLQKEVAMRLCADVGDSDYGRLTISVRAVFSAEMVMEVLPNCFMPPPKVHSAVVRLRPLKTPLSPPNNFDEVLRAAFQSRRKTLRNALRHFDVDWQGAGINADLRPQNLSPHDYAKLARHIKGGDK